MKYGMNMFLWTDNCLDDKWLPLFERLKGMGYDGVEIPIFDLSVERYASLGKHLNSLGLEVTAVTVSTPEANPISPDATIRNAASERLKKVLDCCAAAQVTLLSGPYYAALGQFSGKAPTPSEVSHSLECLRPISAYAKSLKIGLALEFLNRFEIYLLNDAATTAKFCKELDDGNTGVLYDTFHAHIEEKSVTDAIHACKDRLRHVHISENDRSTPGKGQVAWKETWGALRSIGYDGWLTIEAFGQGLPSMVAATKIWRRMFHDEETLASDALTFMKTNTAQDFSQSGK